MFPSEQLSTSVGCITPTQTLVSMPVIQQHFKSSCKEKVGIFCSLVAARMHNRFDACTVCLKLQNVLRCLFFLFVSKI